MILVTDTVFPMAFAGLNNLLDKKVKIKSNQLMLNEEQKTALMPLADQAAKYLSININPVVGYLIVSTIFYGNNFINLKADLSTGVKPDKETK